MPSPNPPFLVAVGQYLWIHSSIVSIFNWSGMGPEQRVNPEAENKNIGIEMPVL